jgi:hypothetical protein
MAFGQYWNEFLVAQNILMMVDHLLEGTFYEEEQYDRLQARQEVRHRNAPSRLSSDSVTASREPLWRKGEALQLPTSTPCSLLPRGVTREWKGRSGSRWSQGFRGKRRRARMC